tara:strand:- start:919 stop:1413 length:495 start_codon:yes stop_codon:yes gene_type:complete
MTGNFKANFAFPKSAFVGFEHIFNDLEQMASAHKKDHYPPHNIVELDDAEYVVELAVVGFKESDLDIKLHDGILTVKGDRPHRRNQELYVHKGISGRKFERSFRLSEFVEVVGADLADGLLAIHLKKIIPEDKRPRTINISTSGVKNDNSSTTSSPELLNESAT